MPAALTRAVVRETLLIVATELRSKFGIARRASPSAASIRTPAKADISAARRSTSSRRPSPTSTREDLADFVGPLPADTMFVPDHARHYDAVVAMYHDQGLPVLKAASFGLRHQRDARAAVPAHVGRPRDRARSRARDPALARDGGCRAA